MVTDPGACKMRHSQIFLVVLLAIGICSTSAQNLNASLWIQHPQQTWRYGQGTIEQATLVIRDKGGYAQHDLYLTLSARGLSFGAADSVEIQYTFDLPPNAIVADLWLWVGEDIMRALILDRWTASSVYEGIVKRRQDPAILVKNGPRSYQLRIYPLPGNKTRKVKLSYLVPMGFNAASTWTAAPLHLLRSSKYVPALPIRYFPSGLLASPAIKEAPAIEFTPHTEPELGNYFQGELPASSVIPYNAQASVTFKLAVETPVRLTRFVRGDEGFYQLAFVPAQLLDDKAARRVAILVDLDSLTTTVRSAQIEAGLREMLRGSFTSKDSINLMYRGRDSIVAAGSTWLRADSAGVESMLSLFRSRPLLGVSRLKELLTRGSAFVNGAGAPGNMLLLSASTDYIDYRVANGILAELQAHHPPVTSVVDFCSPYYKYVTLDGKVYYNNDYFNTNLSKQTGGVLESTQDPANTTLSGMLAAIVPYLRGAPAAFDLYTTTAGGFCFGRMDVNVGTTNEVLWDRPILQVGKFAGGFPFRLEIATIVEGAPFKRSVVITQTEAIEGDSMSAQVWAGNQLAAMELEPASNPTNAQIVDLSLRERVLSTKTAFLALEPNDTLKACVTCKDESVPAAVAHRENRSAADSVLQAYPNPFNASTTLTIRLPGGVQASEATATIFNTLGQAIRKCDSSGLSDSETRRLVWDGRGDNGQPVATGMYLFVLAAPGHRSSLKLMVVK
jgi:hypothetical protein